MKKKFLLLSRTLLLLIMMVFAGNVSAEEFNGWMKDAYSVYTPTQAFKDGYDYMPPRKLTLDDVELSGSNSRKFAIDYTSSDGTYYIKGVSAAFAAPNSGTTNFTNNSVKFKKVYTIDGQDVDVKVTLRKLVSNADHNEVRVYVNESFDSNTNKSIHRYLGFGIFNDQNGASAMTTDLNNIAYVTLEFYKSGTNELYKNNKLMYLYNDIDATKAENNEDFIDFTELLKLESAAKSNVFVMSSDSKLKIQDGVISSTDMNKEDRGWLNPKTQKVSLLVKGDSSLQQSGKIEFGFGTFLAKEKFSVAPGQGRGGQNDIQFLYPISYEGKKQYSTATVAGKDHVPVKLGDVITYQVNLKAPVPTILKQFTAVNPTVDVKVEDTLSKGLEYVAGSASLGNPTITNNSDGTTKLVWNTTLGFTEGANTKTLTYKVKVVSGYVENKVLNDAYAVIGNVKYHLGTLENPIPEKNYASDTPAGLGGAKVKKGDVIRYSIKYSNVLNEKQKVKIVDTISKGLKYKANSAKFNGTALEPKSVTQNSDGSYTIVWEKEIAKKTTEELKYEVDVVGGVEKVNNRASMYYARLKSDGTFGSYGEEIYLNKLENPLSISLVVKKLDFVNTTKLLKGAKLEIRKAGETTVAKTNGGVAMKWTSGDSEKVFEDVVAGDYVLYETEAPAGYTLTDPILFTIDKTGKITINGQNKTEVIVTNSLNEISFKKIDKATNSPLKGAVLRVVDKATGTTAKDINGNELQWTTDGNAKKISGLKDGEYYVEEVSAPAGYVKSDVKTNFTVQNGNIVYNGKTTKSTTLTVENNKNRVVFSKKDEKGNLLAGATLRVVNKSTKKTAKDIDGKELQWTTTTKNNPYEVKGLAKGNYYLEEVKAPEGYVKSNDVIEFSIDEKGVVKQGTEVKKDVTLIMTNVVTKLYIDKIDAKTGKQLAGAHLQLQDENGKVIEEWDTTEESHYIEGLPVGHKYTIVETKAPEGYNITKPITFEIDEHGKIIGDTVSASKDNTVLVPNTLLNKSVTVIVIGGALVLAGMYITKRSTKKANK